MSNEMPVNASNVPFSALGLRSGPPSIARLMAMALETPGLLSLAAGFTDNLTLPVEAVRDAVDGMSRQSGEPVFLLYGTNQGWPVLRRLLAESIASREPGLDAAVLARDLLMTNGSQQALYLAMQVLCDPGDIVLVDRPSYFVFLEMLAGLGVRALSLPTDREGRIDPDALGALLAELAQRGEASRLKALYFVSYFSNPSSRSLDEQEKTSIAIQLERHGLCIPVIEDGAYRELYFRKPAAARSVLSLPGWRAFPKLYLETLTKPFATGLKVGYGVCSERSWLEKMLHVKGCHDFGTANFTQAIFERVLANGGYAKQLERIRPHYEHKMHELHDTLLSEGLAGLGWRWTAPEGGLYLWLEAPAKIDTSADSDFCRDCIHGGVLYVPGDLCFGDHAPRNFVRLSFGVLDGEELCEAGRRFVAVARRYA